MQEPESAVPTTDNVRFEYETHESIQALNRKTPLPPANNPSPDGVGCLSNSVVDRMAWESSTGVALISPRRPRSAIEQEDLESKNPYLSTEVPNPTRIRAAPPPRQIKPSASRCAPCRFAGVPKVRAFVKACCWS